MGFLNDAKEMLERPGNYAQSNEIIKIINDYKINNELKALTLDTTYDEMIDVRLFTPEFLENIAKQMPETLASATTYDSEIEVIAQDSLVAASEMGENTLVLNFACATKPGGQFEKGDSNQESDLCRKSTLYASLTSDTARDFYELNKYSGGNVYTDFILLSPTVTVFANDSFNPLETQFKTAVISASAILLKDSAAMLPSDYISYISKRRIRNILNVAIMNGYTKLVLGAWGCGAAGHDPAIMAESFRSILKDEEYKKYFEKIKFAIYTKTPEKNINYNTFKNAFSSEYTYQAPELILYSRPNKAYGYLCNSFKSNFTDTLGITYSSVVQYYAYSMATTFEDKLRADRIMNTCDPKSIMDFTETIDNFDSETWNVKIQMVLTDAMYLKFSQNEVLKQKLLETGDALLAFANDKEKNFGIGLPIYDSNARKKDKWKGKNIAGYSLMNVRDKLRRESGS